MTHSILLRSFAPLPSTLSLTLPEDATTSTLLSHLADSHSLDPLALASCRLSTLGGRRLGPAERLMEPSHRVSSHHPLSLELRPLTLGGKGGFGSMLRAQGGKMSSRRGQENTDSCRDLSGRRLSTMKQAQALAAYLESKPEREKALDERQKKKFAKLERMLGRRPRDSEDFIDAARRMEDAGDAFDAEEEGGSGSSKSPEAGQEDDKGEGSSRRPQAPSTSSPLAGSKRERLEDHTFVEESREIVEGVRSAVAAAMMKKRKLKKSGGGGGAKGAATSKPTEAGGKGKAVAA